MKHNHEKVEQAIRTAIAACGYDGVFADTKRYLSSALSAAQKVSAKRKRNANTQETNRLAKQKHDEWWDMIKKNAVNNFNEENLKPDEEPNDS